MTSFAAGSLTAHKKLQKQSTIAAFLGLFTVLVVNSAMADTSFSCQSGSPKDTWRGVVEQIETAYQKIGTFQASFRQESYLLGLDTRDYSSGTVVFQKPGKMKWIYKQPEHQQFVADGKMAWFYQPQLEQVTLTDYGDAFSSDLPVTFLLGLGSLNDTFKTSAVCTTSAGIKLELKPKEQDGSLDLLHLLVDAKSFAPLGARIDNVGGNETTIVFNDPVLNKELDRELFSFSVPKGIDIIDNRQDPRS